MKKLLFLLLILVPWSVMAQDNDEERDSVRSNTKYGVMFLKKGVFIKFEDFKVQKYPYTVDSNIPKIKASIRNFYGTNKNIYFIKLRIGNTWVFIEYSDLVEINKAIEKLKYEVDYDCLKMPEYIKNAYISDDDFVVGYWVEKKLGKYTPTWYFDFDNSNRYLPIIRNIDINKVSKMFQEKQAEIEEMMAMDK